MTKQPILMIPCPKEDFPRDPLLKALLLSLFQHGDLTEEEYHACLCQLKSTLEVSKKI